MPLDLRGDARAWINDPERLEGCDIWRKLTKVVRSRSEVRGHGLLSHLHRLITATKVRDALMALGRGMHRSVDA